jgi:cytochrome c oxidase subunit IV
MKDNNTSLSNYNIIKKASTGVYLLIWGILMLFTAMTVMASNFNIKKYAIVICLAIAAIKSTLVLLYFMHLRYEKSTVIKILIPVVITVLTIFIGLTYFEVITR